MGSDVGLLLVCAVILTPTSPSLNHVIPHLKKWLLKQTQDQSPPFGWNHKGRLELSEERSHLATHYF